MRSAAAAARRHPWLLAFGVAGLAIIALKLSALGTSPPGLYVDEASIGYNAWSIAHHGVDEHGNSFPLLYFPAFGEYKNSLYIYLLAPLTWVLPLTTYVVRLPAALCGIAVCALVGATAWTVMRDRAVALAALVTAGVTPWLTLESRVGFEVVSMTVTLTLAIWCYANAVGDGPRASRWLLGCGIALGLSVFAYSTGRVFVATLVILLIAVDGRWRRLSILPALLPVFGAYVLLGVYARNHPGALTSRFNLLSIGSDDPGLITEAYRFLRNYFTYDSVPFLFTNGDGNLRHSTGYGGVLLVTTLPLVVLGLVRCVRSWREPVSRMLLAGLVAGPVPASLTAEGTPHALRSATMLPFLLVIIAYGWAEILPVLTPRRLVASFVALALAIDAGGFMWDLFVRYPARAVESYNWFDAGAVGAIQTAHEQAGSHRVYVSNAISPDGQMYIQALFALTPPPVTQPQDDSQAAELAQVGITVLGDASEIAGASQSGDILVLAPDETAPQGSTLVDTEEVIVAPDAVTIPDVSRVVVLVRVWRR